MLNLEKLSSFVSFWGEEPLERVLAPLLEWAI